MHWLTFLLPRTLVQTSSPFNRDIRVIEDAGHNKLMVNGAHESSVYIAKFWGHALKHLKLPNTAGVKNILIFGVAGGTVIQMLAKKYPVAQMVGVDIDPVMISLGRKYFELGNIPNLSFVVADAQAYVQKRHTKKYDLVVIDIYIGRQLPDFLSDTAFLSNVKKLLNTNGSVLMNYLRDGEYEQKAKNLEEKLSSIFSRVSHADYLNNRFFLAQK